MPKPPPLRPSKPGKPSEAARVWDAGKKELVELPPELLRKFRPVNKPQVQAALVAAWRYREMENTLRKMVPGAGGLYGRAFLLHVWAQLRRDPSLQMQVPEFENLTPEHVLALLRGAADALPVGGAGTEPRPATPEEATKSRARRGRPRVTPNQHPEVEPYLDAVSKAAKRPITIQDFCRVSGFADDTIFGFWRQGESSRCQEAHAKRFERTLTLKPEKFLAMLAQLTEKSR